ncbi:MAG: nucleotidyltransferase domain-containing protein [Proteobacteria bacterium]|nr:nucleotidyltransferase domain-containing protein [Pseudomonadota bacterium]
MDNAFNIYTLDEIKKMVLTLIRKYRAEKAILFGSYARQEARADSDIDLMIMGGKDFEPTDIFCVAEDLHRMSGKSVDVYEQREIDAGSVLLNSIRTEGIVIQ